MLTLKLLNYSIKIISKLNKFLPFSFLNQLRALNAQKEEIIFKKIKKHYPNQIKSTVSVCDSFEKKKIWVFWYQGLESAPDIVRACISSIFANNSDYDVVLLTKNNIRNYFDVPPHIKAKLLSGKITITHFSDILRFYLLYNYGGIWIDATIFLTKPVSAIFSDRMFGTLKQTLHSNTSLSNTEGKWTGYFIKAPKGAEYLNHIYTFFYNYWLENEVLIDYFLIDYAIKYTYFNDEIFRDIIDGNTLNGDGRYLLINILKKKASQSLIDKINFEPTGVHKLSFKLQGLDFLEENTVYHYILNKYSKAMKNVNHKPHNNIK